jgi:hypothetical protein
MSLAELMPSIHALPRDEKFRLAQELLADLAHEEGLLAGEYAIWSPYDAHDAAGTLLRLLGDYGVIVPATFVGHAGAGSRQARRPTITCRDHSRL